MRRQRAGAVGGLSARIGATVGWLALFTLLAAIYVTWLTRGSGTVGGDYPMDAGRALDAIFDGDLGALFHGSLMGPLSLLLRLPIVAISRALGGADVVSYRAGVVACMTFSFAIAWPWLRGRIKLGLPAYAAIVAVVLAVAGPLASPALGLGHPEELVAGIFCVAAVISAARGREPLALFLLACAILTKQWAVVAAAPVLAAMSRYRAATLIAVAVGSLIALGGLAVSGHFELVQHQLDIIQSQRFVTPKNLWWIAIPGAEHGLPHSFVGNLVNSYAHLAIVLIPAPLAFLAWRRRPAGSNGITTDQGLALLAFVLVLRGALDPWNNIYYMLPAFLAVLAIEAERLRAPVHSVAMAASALLMITWGGDMYGPDVGCLLFLAWAVAVLLATAGLAFAFKWPAAPPLHAKTAVPGSQPNVDVISPPT